MNRRVARVSASLQRRHKARYAHQDLKLAKGHELATETRLVKRVEKYYKRLLEDRKHLLAGYTQEDVDKHWRQYLGSRQQWLSEKNESSWDVIVQKRYEAIMSLPARLRFAAHKQRSEQVGDYHALVWTWYPRRAYFTNQERSEEVVKSWPADEDSFNSGRMFQAPVKTCSEPVSGAAAELVSFDETTGFAGVGTLPQALLERAKMAAQKKKERAAAAAAAAETASE
ncbi:MAG: hypothetical protein MHM6MM_008351 [Cercozoa sp. M6MM]